MKITKKILILSIIVYAIFNSLIYKNICQATSSATSQTIPNQKFTLASEGAILMDSNTGKVLYGKNENSKLYPASTTKILTAIIAIENCKPTDKISASYNAVMSIPSGYSNAAIQPDETIDFQNLLDMFLIQSANEIGYIFAEHISGSVENFAKLMNKKALELGCKNSNFTNPSGIHDENHYSTAYDMALIAKYCMKNSTFRNVVSKTSCTVEATDKYEKRYFRNTNDLLNSSSKYYYKYAIGTKTGYTSQAKRCLVATSLKDGLELITVVLGAQSSIPDSRYLDTINLFEYGYSNYKFEKIAVKDSRIKEITVENATKNTKNLSLVLKNDINGIVPVDYDFNNLDYTVKLNNLISAPIQKGDTLGKVTYKIGDFEYSADLISNSYVEKSEPLTVLWQIALALFILFLLLKFFTPKKKKKRKKSNFKKDKIYKFN